MLSASTSMPCASIAASRALVSAISSPGASSGWPISAAAAGTMQWAWMSMVLTRLPAITVSRRRGCALGGGTGASAPAMAQGMKARADRLLASRSPVMDIAFLPMGGLMGRSAGI